MLAVTVTPHKITQAVILSLQHAMEARNVQEVGGVVSRYGLAWLMLCSMAHGDYNYNGHPFIHSWW